MKIRPMGDDLFHADGRTDMTNLIFMLSFFAILLKRLKYWYMVPITMQELVQIFD